MTNNKSVFILALKAWLPFALIIIMFSGLVYGVVQQNYRQGANDPQVQVAEDIATAISQGQAAPDTIVPPNPTTDIGQSLSAFVEIFSATTTPIGSSVSLNGKLPTLPAGTFNYAKTHLDDRFTWQPEPGVRIAAVLKYFNGPTSGYVLAGRSLKEIEIREHNLLLICSIACLATLILTYLLLVLIMFLENKKEEPEHTTPSEHGHHHHS